MARRKNSSLTLTMLGTVISLSCAQNHLIFTVATVAALLASLTVRPVHAEREVTRSGYQRQSLDLSSGGLSAERSS